MKIDRTFARQIDALGGYGDDHSASYNEGYTAALTAADPIAQDADACINELVEVIDALLKGAPLAAWAAEATVLVRRVREQCQ
ncbi:MAG: hypothetical protein ACRYGI_11510 [Janthinobacterium lividum]